MEAHLDGRTYRELRERLSALQSQPEPDMAAIDKTIQALALEQRRLKAEDGQGGNNPIEPDPPRRIGPELGMGVPVKK